MSTFRDELRAAFEAALPRARNADGVMVAFDLVKDAARFALERAARECEKKCRALRILRSMHATSKSEALADFARELRALAATLAAKED